MSKVVYFIILGGLVLAAIAVININDVNAEKDTKFISISVLSKKQANYAADDKNLSLIPAVSVEILEDKVHDVQQKTSIPIIRYTSLPAEAQGSGDQDKDNKDTQSPAQDVPHNNPGNHGNGSTNENAGSGNNNGNGNASQDANNNGDNNTGGSTNSSNDKGKETKPDKNSAPENKGTAPDTKPDKVK